MNPHLKRILIWMVVIATVVIGYKIFDTASTQRAQIEQSAFNYTAEEAFQEMHKCVETMARCETRLAEIARALWEGEIDRETFKKEFEKNVEVSQKAHQRHEELWAYMEEKDWVQTRP